MFLTPWLRSVRARLASSKKRDRRRAPLTPETYVATVQPSTEKLEDRTLLSTINWVNRGTPFNDSDNFVAVWGAQNVLARQIVDAAIADVENVVDQFNRPSLSNVLDVNISMDLLTTGFQSTTTVFDDVARYPASAMIELQSGNDLAGGGYFLDLTPNDSVEFEAISAYAGVSPQGGPADGLFDFYSTILHELVAAVGLNGNFSNKLSVDPANGMSVNTNLADDALGGGVGNFFIFDGPSVTHLMTANVDGPLGSDALAIAHTAGLGGITQPINYDSPFRGSLNLGGVNDLNNAVLQAGTRYLFPDYTALVLQDAYDYQITLPSDQGTFYAMQNETTGEVLIQGGPLDSDDTFTLSRNGDRLVVSVDIGDDTAGTGVFGDDRDAAAFTSTFDLATVTSINLKAGDGDDVINIDVNGGNPIPDSVLNLLDGGGQTGDVINVMGVIDVLDHGFGNPFDVGDQLDDAATFMGGVDVGSSVNLSNGPGDGTVTIPMLMATGTFDQADYDPFGNAIAMNTVNNSLVYFREGTLGNRTDLDAAATNVSSILSTGTEAFSTFDLVTANTTLQVELTQTLEPLFDALGNQTGTILTQTYDITNVGGVGENFEMVRFLDSALEFDGSTALDGGGHQITKTGEEVIVATDRAGNSRTPTDFIGITGENGTAEVINRFQVGDDTLETDIQNGLQLLDNVVGDTNMDEYIDVGNEEDTQIAVRNVYSIAPGGSDLFTTHTIFGTGAPVDITTPLAGTGTLAVQGLRTLYTGITAVNDTSIVADKGFDYFGMDNIANFDDNGVVGDGLSEASEQSGEGALVTYQEPTSTITLRLGNGSDDFNINAFDSTANAQLTIDGQDGDDTLDASILTRQVIINGGMGDDVITGTNFDDTITGAEGDDVIDGLAGSDQLVETADVNFTLTDLSLTGLGIDALADIDNANITGGPTGNVIDASGFSGPVTLTGLDGNDQLFAGAGDDILDPGQGNDLVDGNDGNDFLMDSGGGDTLIGDGDNDTIFSGTGDDSVVGGAGIDDITVNYITGVLEVEGGTGADFIRFADAAVGGAGSITIRAEDGLDSISGAPIIGTPVVIDGGNPPFGSNPGDLLSISVLDPGLTNPIITDNGDGTGSVTSDLHAPITWSDIEVLTTLNDPNLSFDADLAVGLGGDGANSGDTDNFRLIRTGAFASLEVDGTTVAQFPVVGVQSVTIAGSNDDDILDVDETGGILSFAVNFDGSNALTQDVVRVLGAPGADIGTYLPSKTTVGSGTLTVQGNPINFTNIEPAVEATGFTSFTFGTANSDDDIQLSSTMNLANTQNALTITGSSAGVGFTPLISYENSELIIDAATADGGVSDDVVTLNPGALSFEPLDSLSTLTIQTGQGNDTIQLVESSFNLPNGGTPGGTLNLDGGTATDLLVMTAQPSGSEPDVSYVLTTTSADNGSLTATIGGNSSTVNLLNFAGEAASLIGNDSNNLFDLSGWNQLSVATVIGGGGDDTLIGVSQDTTWNITNTFLGAASNDSGDAGGFEFSDIDNLQGGAAADTFVVKNGVVFSGSIDGAAGNDSLDLSDFTSGKGVTLTSSNANGFAGNSDVVQRAFSGVDNLIGGQSPNDGLTGLSVDATWELDGTNTYTDDQGFVLAFEGVEQLTGGNQDDTFLIQGTRSNNLIGGGGDDTFRFTQAFSLLVGSIVGNAGSDTIDMSQFTTQRNITLTSSDVNGFSGVEDSITATFSGIDGVVGGATSTNDNLFGLNTDAAWDITADNAGVYTDSVQSVTLGFSSIENLTGSDAVDTFSFENQAALTGIIEGAGGLDALIGDDAQASETFIVDGGNTGLLLSGTMPLLNRFNNIETLIGGAGADSFTFTNSGSLDGLIDGVGGIDSVVGDNNGNVFNITSNDAGSLDTKVNLLSLVPNGFINVENLTGGSGVDLFNIDAPIVGTLDGRSGNDRFEFNESGVVGASLIGGTGFDTLVGDDDGNIFTITGNGVQQATGRGILVTKTDVFIDIETLVGGAGADQFNFDQLGSIVGTVDGMGGDNTLAGDNDGNVFSVSSQNSGLLFGKLTLFTNIQNLVGGAADDTYTINALLEGDVSSLNGDDTLLIGAAGTIGGDLDTGALADTLDITGTIVGNVDLGLQDDTIIFRNGAQLDSNVNGNSGDDLFDIRGTVTMNNPLNGDAGDDTYLFSNSGNINVLLDGGANSDTLIGDDDGNVFTITAANAGSLPAKAPAGFQFIENLTGGAAVDTFAINADLAGNIVGNGDNDVVTVAANQNVGGDIDGNDGNDSFTIASGADVSGTIRGGNNDDSIAVDYVGSVSRTLTFDGGANNDAITVTGGGIGATGTYNTGAAADEGSLISNVAGNTQMLNFSGTAPIDDSMTLDTLTINGTDQNNSFNVIDGTVAGFTEVNFSGAFSEINFQNKTNVIINALDGTDTVNLNNPNPAAGLVDLSVNGDGGNDTINIQVNHNGSLTGGDGNDSFVYTNGMQVAGSIDGNAGTDTINGQFFTTSLDVALTANDPNGHTGTESSLLTGTFAGIDSIRGGSGADSLTGISVPSTWDLDGTNQYTAAGETVAFSGFETLNGGTSSDTFNVTGFQTLAVNGGQGSDVLELSNGALLNGPFDGGEDIDTLSFAASTIGHSVTLTSNVVDGFNGTASSLVTGGFLDVDSLTGGGGADTLTGQDIASTWEVDGTNRYIDATTTRSVAFSAFENLQGGSLGDTYNISGDQTVNLLGGIGDDTFDFANNATLTGTIDGGDNSDVVDFQDYLVGVAANAGDYVRVEEIIGGATLDDSLLGGSGSEDFNVTDTDEGTVNTIMFSSFENLLGQGGDDTFNLQFTGSLSGMVDGNDGADELNLATLVGGPHTVTLTALGATDGFDGSQASLLGSFENIDALTGTGSDTLNGADIIAMWTLNGSSNYTSGANSLDFTGFSNLNGGALADSFNINGSTTVELTGQAGDDIFNIADMATLTGSINGGDDNDAFNLGNGSMVTGNVDGEAGADGLSFAPSTAAVNVTLDNPGADGFDGSVANIAGGFDAINNVTGSGVGGDILNGLDSASNWAVDSLSTYTDTVSTNTIDFSGFESLNGGSMVDTFTVSGSQDVSLNGNDGDDSFTLASDDAAISGSVVGGSGTNTLSFTGLTTNNANVNLTGNALNGFSGTAGSTVAGGFDDIFVLDGGSGANDTLTGQNVVSNWLIDPINTYEDDGTGATLTFAAFENLTGGSDVDTFNIRDIVQGDVNTGDQGDVVDVSSTGNVSGGINTAGGDDLISIDDGGIVDGLIDSSTGADLVQIDYAGTNSRALNVNIGSGDDELRLTGVDPTANVMYAVGPGATQGFLQTDIGAESQTITFDGADPSGSDLITDRQAGASITVNGSNSGDTINVIDGLVDITFFTEVNFNGAFPELQFQSKPRAFVNGLGNADTINIDNPNMATGIVGLELQFINALGGDGNDTFNVLNDHSGDLTGNNGNDTFVFADGITITDDLGTAGDPIDGGNGVDTLDFAAVTSPVAVNLNASGSTGFSGSIPGIVLGASNFSGIDSIAGGQTGNDSLTGLNTTATWGIDGSNTYLDQATGRLLSFTDVEELVGNSMDDDFQISGSQGVSINGLAGDDNFSFLTEDAAVTGFISGENGNDTLDFSALATTSVDVVLTGNGFVDGFDGTVAQIGDIFTDINNIVGGGASDSLTGQDMLAGWAISAAGSTYTSGAGLLTFDLFDTLNGGSNQDSFTIVGNPTADINGNDGDDAFLFADGAVLNGTIDGGDHSIGDMADFGNYTTPLALDITSIVNVENIVGGSTANDSLLASDGNDIINISGSDSGDINGLPFSDFENIDGLAGDDVITFTMDAGVLTGSVDGNGGNDTLSFSGITGATDLTLDGLGSNNGFAGNDGGNALAGFDNINSLGGNNPGTATLTGLDNDSTWTVAASGNYNALSRNLGISGFGTLSGGSEVDTFNVTESITVNINTGDEVNNVNIGAGATLTGAVVGGVDDDVVSLADGAILMGSFDGGNGTDTADFSGNSLAQDLVLTSAVVGDGFDGSTATANYISLEAAIGGSGDDSVTGLNTVSNWTIDGSGSTYADTISGETFDFSGIDNAIGGSDVDTFNAIGSATIDLLGYGGNDVFSVSSNVTITGALDGGANDDAFNFAGAINVPTTIDGGSENDTVDFSAGITSVSIDLNSFLNVENVTGTTLSDSLAGSAGNDTFNITANNQGSVGTLNFVSFEHLAGNAGDDSFVLANGVGVSGSVDGGTGADLLDYSAYNTDVTVDLAGGTASNVGTTVSGVENATGGSGNDTLIGSSDSNVLVGGMGNDQLTDGLGDDNLDGGSGDDIYFLTPGSADILTDASGTDTLDFSLSTGPINIDLDDMNPQNVLGSNSVDLNGTFENFVGSDGGDTVTANNGAGVTRTLTFGSGNDTLISSVTAGINGWQITGPDQGNLGPFAFSNVENLTGSTVDDQFNFADLASISGIIDGNGSLFDVLDFSAYSSTGAVVDLDRLVNVEFITGSGQVDTLNGSAAGSNFVVQSGSADQIDGIAVTTFDNYVGGTGNDSFTFGSGATIPNIDGGAGSNSLTLSGDNDAVTFSSVGGSVGFDGSATGVTDFANIDSFDTGGGTDSITGLNAVATWTVDGSDTYVSSGRSASLTGAESYIGGTSSDIFNVSGNQSTNLFGGAGLDVFDIADGSMVTGTVDGQVDSDSLVFNGPTAETIMIGAVAGIDGFTGTATSVSIFDNINVIQGGSGSDSLAGSGIAATYNLSTTGNSYVEGATSLSFSSIETLNGGVNGDVFTVNGNHSTNINAGGGNDTLRFLTNGSSTTGTVDLGDQSDTVDFSALSAAVTVNVSDFLNVENLIGSLASDTLIGNSAGSTFNVNGASSGDVDGTNFSSFETLQGGAGADSFVLSDGASIAALIGAGGSDSLDLSAFSSARSVSLTAGLADGFAGSDAAIGTFTGIDTLTGSGQTGDSLTGVDANSIWDVGANTYTTSSRTLNFGGFETLTGNASRDTFNISANSSAVLNGGAGDDTFALSDGVTFSGTASGASGVDTLDLSALSTAVAFTVAGVAADGFSISASGFSNAAGSINNIIGSNQTDTLNGLSAASTWTAAATDTYVSTNTLTATSIETRIGGTASDSVSIQADSLPAGQVHTFLTGSSADSVAINLAAGASIDAGTTLAINTGSGNDSITVNANASGDGARSLSVDYQSSVSGDVNVGGIGGVVVDLDQVESLTLNGDSNNNDTLAVNGTPADDAITVVPGANSAAVSLAGSTSISVSGLNNTSGLSIDGAAGANNQLQYDGNGMINVLTATSGSITEAGNVDIAYSNIGNLDAMNPVDFTIDGQTEKDDTNADTFNLALNGGSLELTINGGTTLLSADPSNVKSLVVNGSGDDDTLTVDYAGGDPLPAGGLTFNGLGQTNGDSIIVNGDGNNVGDYTPSSTIDGDGTITVDGNSIVFTGLEPATVSNMSEFTFTSPNGADSLTVDSPAAGQNRISGTSGGVGFEALTVSNIGQLNIDAASNGGAGQDDQVTFSSDIVGASMVSITTGQGDDTIDASNVTIGLSIISGAGDDNITGSSGDDNINAGSGTDTINQAGADQTLSDTQVTGAGTDIISGVETAILRGDVAANTINAGAFTGTAIIDGLEGNDTIFGGSGNDILIGGVGADNVQAGDGNDFVYGGSQADVIDGQGGDDQLFGQGSSSDFLTGGTGNDVINGGGGNDRVVEVSIGNITITNDTLVADGLGTDTLIGIEHANLTAGTGNDTIDLSGFTNNFQSTVYGGEGNDLVIGSDGVEVVLGEGGNDTLQGNGANDTLLGSAGKDVLIGGSGNDFIRGQGASGDQLSGGEGDDILDGGAGNDFITESGDVDFTLTDGSLSGLGNDTIMNTEFVTLNGGDSANTLDASAATIVTFLNGGGGDDVISGGSNVDVVTGGDGADMISTGDGDDLIDAGSGDDNVDGGSGTDQVMVSGSGTLTVTDSSTTGAGTDSFSNIEEVALNGGAGNDVLDASATSLRTFLSGNAGDDVLISGPGNDVINGGDGNDQTQLTGTNIVLTDTSFSGTGSDVVISVETIQLNAGDTASLLDASGYTGGNVSLVGGPGNDTLRGGSGNDVITGNDGNDLIEAGAGNDIVNGNNGQDMVDGGAGDDVVDGGGASDTVNGGDGNDLVRGGVGNDMLDGGDGNDFIEGENGFDTARGGAGDDTIEGGAGNDVLFGQAGIDSLTGGDGEDGLNGGADNDFLVGDFGNDTLIGGDGNDNLLGGANDDVLVGGDGDDYVRGNGGKDTLSGNAGTDTIVGDASEIDEAFNEGMFPELMA